MGATSIYTSTATVMGNVMLVSSLLFHLFTTQHWMPPAATHKHDSIVYYAAVELMNWLCGTSAIQYIVIYRNWIDIKSSYLILLEQHSDYTFHLHTVCNHYNIYYCVGSVSFKIDSISQHVPIYTSFSSRKWCT